MALLCVVVVEMIRPGTPLELYKRWKLQREHSDNLSPEPNGQMRAWKGEPEARDWDALVGIMRQQGWGLLSHRREFVFRNDDKVQDKAELG